MHRTQILLRLDQYQALKRLARARRTSLGELIRVIVDREIGAASGTPAGIEAIRRAAGFIEKADARGRDHDDVLYGSVK